MGILQGNFGAAPVNPIGIDYSDSPIDGFGKTALTGLGAVAFPNAINSWSTTTGVGSAWVLDATLGATVRSTQAVVKAGMRWEVPTWPLFVQRPGVVLGEVLPSLRYRWQALMQLVPGTGPVPGSAVGLSTNDVDARTGWGIQAEIDAAGDYVTVARKQAFGAPVTTAGIGPISALAPHMWEMEVIHGPANRLRFWLAGTLVHEEESGSRLFTPFGVTELIGPAFWRPANALTGYWAYFGGRLRIDYV